MTACHADPGAVKRQDRVYKFWETSFECSQIRQQTMMYYYYHFYSDTRNKFY